MNRHTPYPWQSSECGRINDSDPLFVATMAYEGKKRRIICRIENRESGKPIDDEDIANARLIAAAPELLEALKGLILGFNDNNLPVSEYSKMVKVAQQAIAKAEGGE